MKLTVVESAIIHRTKSPCGHFLVYRQPGDKSKANLPSTIIPGMEDIASKDVLVPMYEACATLMQSLAQMDIDYSQNGFTVELLVSTDGKMGMIAFKE